MGKWLIIIGLCCYEHTSSAQQLHLFGLLPGVQLDGKLQGQTNYFFQFASESQPFNHYSGGVEFPAEIRNFDLHAGLSRDLGTNWNLAAAFLARLREPLSGDVTTELRPWQQLTYVSRLEKFRFRQRARAEFRFVQREPGQTHQFDLRLRYRLSVDFPLDGERLDDREFYANSSVEFVVTPTRNDAFYYREWRLTPGIGYRISKKHRLETAPELRTRRVNQEGFRENFWYWRWMWILAF